MAKVAPEILQHYEFVDEPTRLDGTVELLRVQELMTRFLPLPPSTVLDVGGGAGIHAFWLAARGYDVHLIDAVPRHIEAARRTAAGRETPALATMGIGDARHLDHQDISADAVLLFGPLYHLTDRSDRIQALREALRVLRPNGILMAQGISRFISTITALQRGLINDEDFQGIYEQDLIDGQHRNPTDNQAYFTTSFFHRPEELRAEIQDAGFEKVALLAVEGLAQFLKDFKEYWPRPHIQEKVLEIVRKLEREQHLIGVSTHIMAVARKANDAS